MVSAARSGGSPAVALRLAGHPVPGTAALALLDDVASLDERADRARPLVLGDVGARQQVRLPEGRARRPQRREDLLLAVRGVAHPGAGGARPGGGWGRRDVVASCVESDHGTSRGVERALGDLHDALVVREEQDLGAGAQVAERVQRRLGPPVVEVHEHVVEDHGERFGRLGGLVLERGEPQRQVELVPRAVAQCGHRAELPVRPHREEHLAVAVGVGGAVAGVAVLWFCLCKLDLGEVPATSCQLACVVGVAAACDIGREDSGLIAAVLMGLALANMRAFDVPARRPFFENLVQLIIGVLFVSISATVTPQSLRHLLLPTLGLVAVLVLVTRPLVAFLATSRTDMTRAERQFTGWMAPRGIIAAATASTFGAGLAARHVGGAARILPVTFLVIAMTVVLYGLTAVPVARRLGVIRSGRARPLLVGGASWVIDLARVLRQAGLDVLMWAASPEQRDQIRQAAFELAPGELLSSVIGEGAALEGITSVLLLTDEDDFNALAAMVLAGGAGPPVYRLGPRQPGHGVVAPRTAAETLFGTLTRYEVAERYAAGARMSLAPAPGTILPGAEVLFLITPDRVLIPATGSRAREPTSADTLVILRTREGLEPDARGGA